MDVRVNVNWLCLEKPWVYIQVHEWKLLILDLLFEPNYGGQLFYYFCLAVTLDTGTARYEEISLGI